MDLNFCSINVLVSDVDYSRYGLPPTFCEMISNNRKITKPIKT